MSEYIDFITYQDDAIIQCSLRYYRRRGQPHPQPKGDLHQRNRHRENGTHHDDHLLGLAPGGYSDDIQYHSVGYVGASESKSRLPTKHKVLYSVVKALCMSAFLFAGHSR